MVGSHEAGRTSGLYFQLPFKFSSTHSLHFSGSPRKEVMGGQAAFSPVPQWGDNRPFHKELVCSQAPTSMAPLLSKP